MRAAALLLLVLLITACPLTTAVASVLNPEYAAGYDPETKIYRFQPGDLTVTAYYDDGTSRTLSYDEYELEKPYVQNTGDLSQTVTVNYTENGVTASDKFTVDVDLPIGKRGSVILDCNGGMITPDDNWAVAGQTGAVSTLSKSMIPYGSEITLPTTLPEHDDYEFAYWIDQMTGNKYNPGQSLEMTTTDTLTLKAYWTEPYTVKYAVRLYGINEDLGPNGEILGLTFGPANGYDKQKDIDYQPLINTYVCHDENDPMCLHNMTWEQIIEQSQKDPIVFDACLENGCTHSVCLNIQDAYDLQNYQGQMDDGDGASTLIFSIMNLPLAWKISFAGDTTGGWPNSTIRNTLNGTLSTDDINETNCLLAMFPSILQKNIAPKRVTSVTTITNTDIIREFTYDKLWLFSCDELQKNTNETNIEGNTYPTQKVWMSLHVYNEHGNDDSTWLRSIQNSTSVFVAYGSGSKSGITTEKTNQFTGIAPGFCLP